METSVKLYSLNYKSVKTYLAASIFIIGNMALPQLCHLVPNGGIILLPIYFFTLIGAYKYGWQVGLLTAIFSPLINAAVFGMPAVAALPVILIKSILLAIAAGWAAQRTGRVSILILLAVVLFYQMIGSIGEWIIEANFFKALQDFRMGIPGMLVQIIGGYLFIKYVIRK